MKRFNHPLPFNAENSEDFDSVAVCFDDQEVNELFCELLENHGVPATVVEDTKALAKHTRVITEAQFFDRIPPELRSRCLVVGNQYSLAGIHALALCQPLTEQKVETAIRQLLLTA